MTDFPSSPETASAKIEKHLWDAIDLMAATLEKPDPRVWAMLDIYRPSDLAQTPGLTEPIAMINRRLEDLAEANAIYGNDQRLNAPDKIARNDREISWLKDLRSMITSPDTSTLGNSK